MVSDLGLGPNDLKFNEKFEKHIFDWEISFECLLKSKEQLRN